MRYMVPRPPPKPIMKITLARAGEKRTWRSSAIGSITQRQPRRCGAFSNAAESWMRADVRQIGRYFQLRQLAHLAMKLLHRHQLGGASGAARGVPFQLVTRIVGQFVVEIKRDVFPYPVAIHKCLLRIAASNKLLETFITSYFRSASADLNFCVARNRVFFAVSSVVFRASPMVRSFSPW